MVSQAAEENFENDLLHLAHLAIAWWLEAKEQNPTSMYEYAYSILYFDSVGCCDSDDTLRFDNKDPYRI